MELRPLRSCPPFSNISAAAKCSDSDVSLLGGSRMEGSRSDCKASSSEDADDERRRRLLQAKVVDEDEIRWREKQGRWACLKDHSWLS